MDHEMMPSRPSCSYPACDPGPALGGWPVAFVGAGLRLSRDGFKLTSPQGSRFPSVNTAVSRALRGGKPR